MNILVVDDEKYALECLKESIQKVMPESTLFCFERASEALSFAGENKIDIAFLDIEMANISGISLAVKLKMISPKVNIIFVTGYSRYAHDAFQLHASGYILKPAGVEQIEKELKNLRYPPRPKNDGAHVRIQCFGNFEVFVDGEIMMISRSKVKELLAYLVHKRGTGVDMATITAVLWEDKAYKESLQSQTRKIISQLRGTLREAGVEDIIVKGWNNIAIDTQKVSCDYYDFLKGDLAALNSFTGEYMEAYSWAQITEGMLTQAKFK